MTKEEFNQLKVGVIIRYCYGASDHMICQLIGIGKNRIDDGQSSYLFIVLYSCGAYANAGYYIESKFPSSGADCHRMSVIS